MKIIGFDSAVQNENIGMILCDYSDGKIELQKKWDKKKDIKYCISEWIAKEKCLISIDSPLGWPMNFGDKLRSHYAGDFLGEDKNSFFKRETDLNITKWYGKIPLEVSADRIARTAFQALLKIEILKRISNRKIEIIWNSQCEYDIGYIEVYPASTLLSNSIDIKGYKKNEERRSVIYKELSNVYEITNERNIDIISVEHDFDAFICCLAGVDFLSNRCRPYGDLTEKIKKEGWIWTK